MSKEKATTETSDAAVPTSAAESPARELTADELQQVSGGVLRPHIKTSSSDKDLILK